MQQVQNEWMNEWMCKFSNLKQSTWLSTASFSSGILTSNWGKWLPIDLTRLPADSTEVKMTRFSISVTCPQWQPCYEHTFDIGQNVECKNVLVCFVNVSQIFMRPHLVCKPSHVIFLYLAAVFRGRPWISRFWNYGRWLQLLLAVFSSKATHTFSSVLFFLLAFTHKIIVFRSCLWLIM